MLQFLEQCKANGTLDTMRAPQGHLNAVFCCGDTPFPYLDEYFQYLDPQQFPAIQYEERLLNPEQKKHQPSLSHQKNTSITCTQLYQEAFERGAGTCLPRLREGFYIYDIRTKAEYLHVHVPDAEWIENEELLKKQLLHIPFIKCFIICNYGMKSADMVVRLSGISEHIMSVEGGIVAWSDE
ncbi:MAG: rhodanese-like domain-containing protein [Candidatus Peribacteria bacterium]|jgi:rhodanese-related sulfurtransferase|nr:rhodanese-like domain-containing protein [Candidatus Peribacteria bacterium]